MAVELVVPPAGESITEVEIGSWLKAVGESVSKDETVVEIETDKVTMELPAPATGVITEIRIQQGEEAKVGDVIGMIDENAEAAPTTDGDDSGASSHAEPEQSEGSGTETVSPSSNGEAKAMPAAQRVLAQNNLDAASVKGTGPGGRITKQDAEDAAKQAAAAPAKAPTPAPAAARSAGDAAAREDIQPMTPLRRTIAANLVQAQQTAALLTTFNEVDMSAVMDLRKQYQESFVKRYGIKLGFMSFFVKAAIDALKAFPAVNAEVRETNIVYKNYFDIGIAVGGGRGLVVPVIRDADQLSFAEVEQTIADLGTRARDNKLKLEELQGGTFTITNGGIFGSMMSTPIINPPQSGVLGMHSITKRAIVDPKTDEIKVRPMMYLALSYDHRIVDGREAVQFLVRIKEGIEDPTRMLMEV